jgi:hypothetical protein
MHGVNSIKFISVALSYSAGFGQCKGLRFPIVSCLFKTLPTSVLRRKLHPSNISVWSDSG